MQHVIGTHVDIIRTPSTRAPSENDVIPREKARTVRRRIER